MIVTIFYILTSLFVIYFAIGLFLTYLYRLVNTRIGCCYKDYLIYPFTLPLVVIINVFRKDVND